MADQSEAYTILLRVEGEEKLRKLAQEVENEEKKLRQLAQQAQATGQSQTAFFQQAEIHAQKIATLNGRIAETQKQMAAAGVGARNAGQAIQQLGYAVDDAQYGLRGLSNNIAPLLQSLGAGAGLAGTIAIVATAAAQLYEHWDDIQRLMGMGGTDTEAQRMERLEKATNRTTEETAQLVKMKRELAAVEAQRNAQSKAEGQMTNAVNDAVAELGQPEAVKGLLAINRTRYENSPENTELVQRRDAKAATAAGLRNSGQIPAARLAEKQLAGIQAALDRKVQAQAERDLGRAATDPGFLQGLTNQVIGNPGAFGRGGMAFAQRLMAASPDMQAAEAENRTLGGKQEARAVAKKAEDREAQKAEADWLKFDARQQQGRVRARQQELQDGGVTGMIRQAMLGVAMQGGNADQVLARGTKLFMDQGGLSPEAANEMAKSQMKAKLSDAENPMAAQERASWGPRQIHDIASFKDRVMTSGTDPATRSAAAAEQQVKKLDSIEQLLRNRTFPAVIN